MVGVLGASSGAALGRLHRLLSCLTIVSLSLAPVHPATVPASALQADVQVLLDFRASLPPDCQGSWTDWSTEEVVTNWHGVEVENNRIVGLFLYARNVTVPCLTLPDWSRLDQLSLLTVLGAKGPLPTAWARLTRLAHLDLSNNMLTGTLPQEWGALTNLEDLNLMNNMLSGSLPPQWANLTNLQSLKLNRNRFSGVLPVWREFPWWYLNLSSNQLSGTVSAAWTTFTDVAPTVQTRQFNISNNQLLGPLQFVWKASDSAPGLIIDVSNNGFQGRLPKLPDATLLLNASHNQLNGSLSNLPTRLQHLDLANNRLTGTIPSISSTKLVYADLDNNLFTGLPETIAAPKLTFLSIANNLLHGTLPIWEHAQALVFCDLSHNALYGNIPSSWLQDTWVLLSLHHNQLSGSLPDPWTGRTVALLLQDNYMSGCIPSLWTQNDTLVVLNVSNNPLSCKKGLPEQWGSMTAFHNLSVLHISGSNITGAIPESWLQADNLPCLMALGLEADNWWQAAKSSSASREAICTTDKIYDAMEWYLTEPKLSKLQSVVQESIRCLPGSGFESDYVPDADLMDGVVSYASLLEAQLLQRVNLKFYGECPPEEQMCGLQEAAWLVGVQWGVVGVAIMLMTAAYGLILCIRTRRTAAEAPAPKPMSSFGASFGARSMAERGADTIKAGKMPVAGLTPNGTPQSGSQPSTPAVAGSHLLPCSRLLNLALCCPVSLPTHLSPTNSGIDMYSDSEDSVTPTLYQTCKHIVPWWSIFQVLLHWLDFATDVVFLVHVWPKWPAFGLVTILLFQHVFAATMLASQLGKLGHRNAWYVVLLCMPLLPALDVVMLATVTCQKCKLLPRQLVQLALDWDQLYPMRKVSEVLMESLPAAILQSVVFVLGNSTEAGWFLTVQIYLPAMVTSAVQIILLAAQVFRNAVKDKVSPLKALLDMARSSKARAAHQTALSLANSTARMTNFLYFASGYAAEMEMLEAGVERPAAASRCMSPPREGAHDGNGSLVRACGEANGDFPQHSTQHWTQRSAQHLPPYSPSNPPPHSPSPHSPSPHRPPHSTQQSPPHPPQHSPQHSPPQGHAQLDRHTQGNGKAAWAAAACVDDGGCGGEEGDGQGGVSGVVQAEQDGSEASASGSSS